MSALRRLTLISADQELRGVGPKEFERRAESAEFSSRDHRGLVFLALTLCKPIISSCVPPSAREELSFGVETARLWALSQRDVDTVKSARARCFGAVTAIEDLTDRAVRQASEHLGTAPQTPLDDHAASVTSRYVRLAAHFCTSAVCHLLDACQKPNQVLAVYADLQGARAYQMTGLGAARHAPFRQAAWNQAQWEASRNQRLGAPGANSTTVGALSVQIFHEYLGARYRAHAEATQVSLDRFISWALCV